jgi:hypothetical protein
MRCELAAVGVFAAIAACGGPVPTPTGATCDPSLTWGNFGHDFMFAYCTNCHNSAFPTANDPRRHGAPWAHDFDTLLGVWETALHVDEQAGWGPRAHNSFMPGAGTGGRCPSQLGGPLDEACPQPSNQERVQLAQWMACMENHPYVPDAGVVDTPTD